LVVFADLELELLPSEDAERLADMINFNLKWRVQKPEGEGEWLGEV
jgi:hypothetical protein